jgi:hypothetical protein
VSIEEAEEVTNVFEAAIQALAVEGELPTERERAQAGPCVNRTMA